MNWLCRKVTVIQYFTALTAHNGEPHIIAAYDEGFDGPIGAVVVDAQVTVFKVTDKLGPLILFVLM